MNKFFFAIPAPQPVFEPLRFESTSSCYPEPNSKKTENLKITRIVFDSKTQKLRAQMKCNGFENIIDENFVIHFFSINNGISQFIVTKEFITGHVVLLETVFTNPVKVDHLLKVKPLNNIYVIVKFSKDYDKNLTPIFNPEIPFSAN